MVVTNVNSENSKAQEWLQQGIELYNKNADFKAAQIFQLVLQESPDDKNAQHYLGLCIDRIFSFAQREEAQMMLAERYFQHGVGLHASRNYDKAREAFQQALALRPGHPKTQGYYVSCFQQIAALHKLQ